MATKFSFDNAAFHFARTDGPSGFLWKYLLGYIVVGAVVAAINYGLQGMLFGSMIDFQVAIANGDFPSDMIGGIIIYYLVAIVIGVGFWAMFEAAVQRRYVRDAAFSMGFGADEMRLIAVGLLWVLTIIGGYIVTALAWFGLVFPIAGVIGDSAALGGLWMTIVTIGLMLVWVWVTVKLSAASALTIRDRKVLFTDSWAATKGRFWALFGAYLILGIIILVVYLILAAVFLGGILGSGIDFSDPTSMTQMFTPANFGALFLIMTIGGLIVQSLFVYVWAGPAALAAKTDPRGGGMINIADEFS